MRLEKTFPLFLITAALFLAPFFPAVAASYPEKSIQLIVPYGPGGGVDLMARTFDAYAKEIFDHNFVIVYKPGAGSAVGTTAVAREKPDGYTIGLGSLPHMILHPASGAGRFTLDSFDYIALVASEPQILVTHKDSPYKTYAQLKETAQKAPGKLTLGFPSPLNEGWVAYELINKVDKLDVTCVVYQGGADMTAALLGLQVDAGMVNIGPYYGEIHNLNVLGVTGTERSPYLPDVPTFKEMGVDMSSSIERIFIAPKGLAPEKLKALRAGFKKIWNNPAFQKHCDDLRYALKWIDGENVPAYLEERSAEVLPIYEAFQKTQKKK